MIVLDGVVYRAAADGTVNVMDDDALIPYADVEAEVKKVSVELKREDSLHIGIDNLFL